MHHGWLELWAYATHCQDCTATPVPAPSKNEWDQAAHGRIRDTPDTGCPRTLDLWRSLVLRDHRQALGSIVGSVLLYVVLGDRNV